MGQEDYIAIAIEAVGNTNDIVDCINMRLLEALDDEDTKKVDVISGILNDIKLLMMPVNGGLEH